MELQPKDYLRHKQTNDVYQVRKVQRATVGDAVYVDAYNYRTKEKETYIQQQMDQYFEQIDPGVASDIREMGKVGPADYDSLKAVRKEYHEWKEGFPSGIPPKHDKPYANEEIKLIIEQADNLVELYQYAMLMDRTLTGLRYVIDKARSPENPGKWKSRPKFGVPGDSSYWQVQTVVKDMGGVYNHLLDTRPELEIRL